MYSESLFSASFSELTNIITDELSLYSVALGYVLLFVIYRTLGRYIFFLNLANMNQKLTELFLPPHYL